MSPPKRDGRRSGAARPNLTFGLALLAWSLAFARRSTGAGTVAGFAPPVSPRHDCLRRAVPAPRRRCRSYDRRRGRRSDDDDDDDPHGASTAFRGSAMMATSSSSGAAATPRKRKPVRPRRPSSAQSRSTERKEQLQTLRTQSRMDPTLLVEDRTFASCPDLHPATKRALSESMGLECFTDVQARTFPHALDGSDVLARARTGTGKTLAFLLPAVEHLVRKPGFVPGRAVGCLVVAPTRELAVQIGEEASSLLSYHGAEWAVQVMYGGTKMSRDMHALERRLPAVMIATPGRLLDHLKETSLRGRKFGDDILSEVDVVVLDEIDRLLDVRMGFRRDIQKILSYLPRKEKRQTMCFSATLPKGMKDSMKEYLREDYVEVDCVEDGTDGRASSIVPTNARVVQSHVVLPSMDRMLPSINALLQQAMQTRPFKVVVFFPTARMAGYFADLYSQGGGVPAGVPVVELHSKKSQSSRNTASESFRRAKSAVLFTSDVSARGVDYPDVTHVFQIGAPENRDQYVHRLGRTARAGRDGRGVLVLLPFETRFLGAGLRGLQVPRDEELSDLLERGAAEYEGGRRYEWMDRALTKVRSGDNNKFSRNAKMAYLAFLGYYLGQMRRFRIPSKEEVVRISNEFSKVVGLAHPPPLDSKLATKMDLVGVRGIEIAEEE